MGMFGAIDASASGMTAERLRMDVISNNIANANTTRTAKGGPYRREMVVFEPRGGQGSFASALSQNMDGGDDNSAGEGVKAVGIVEDQSPFKEVYDPSNPDANKNGYVQMPNVNIVTEMVDMITATRAYEANVTAVNDSKNMAMRALDIGK
jgi:flagellar basal-body rod protein FlgC